MWPGTLAIQAGLLPSQPPCGIVLFPSQLLWCHLARPCHNSSLPGAIWPDPVAFSASLVACGQTLLRSHPPLCHVAIPATLVPFQQPNASYYPGYPGAMWPDPVAISASLVPCGQALLPSQPPWCHLARPCSHISPLEACGQTLKPSKTPCCHSSHPCAMWSGTVAIPASLLPCGQALMPSQPTWCHVARHCSLTSHPGAMWQNPVAIPASLVPCGQALLPSLPLLCHVNRPCDHPSQPLPRGQALLTSQPPWCYVARHCCHPSYPGAMWPGPVAIPPTLVPCGQALSQSLLP